MKNIIFNGVYNNSPDLESRIINRIGEYQLEDILKLGEIDIKIDDELRDDIKKDFEGMTYMTVLFIYNVLLNNGAALRKKDPPYDLNIYQMIDVMERKFQLHLYVEDSIFGLVVGSKFKNITSLIQTFYPILAKTDFINEIRFFPISRETFNTEMVR